MASANPHEVTEACSAAAIAFGTRPDAPVRATMLDSIAAALDSSREAIISTCAEETALTPEELAPEFARMTGTLRMFAALIREGSWVRASIDTRVADEPGAVVDPQRPPRFPAPIGPNHDLRKLLIPLGPVAVFGSSNFPLAYGVCGGDTASALAAGCPVIVKEHPAHQRTGRLLYSIAQNAMRRYDRETWLGYIENTDPRDFGPAQALVSQIWVCGVGFTGSTGGGRSVQQIANGRRVPIPVFAEMGSVNPVFVTEAAAERRAEEIARGLAKSILQRFGQQCTCPGTIVVQAGNGCERLINALATEIAAAPGRDMLSTWIKDAYDRRVDQAQAIGRAKLIATGARKDGPRGAAACLLRADDVLPEHYPFEISQHSLSTPALSDEIFGPCAIVVRTEIPFELSIERRGSLTWSFYCEAGETEFEDLKELIESDRSPTGRLIFNGPPTGVRVCTSMVHGGPFPATNAPHTTAVGPLAIERWCRPVCYQNCPDALLPPELQDANPRGILRTVNGVPTRDPVSR